MDNIVLIGMPGCGKSTIGVLLAKILGYSFLDTDLIIQHAEGKRLFEIIRDKGSDYFAETENRILSQIRAHKTVIATGGSAVYGKEAMENLSSIGCVVYLEVSPKRISKRIRNFSTRGIVMENGQSINELYKERHPLYKKYAHITVNCNTGTLRQNAEKIIKALSLDETISANQ